MAVRLRIWTGTFLSALLISLQVPGAYPALGADGDSVSPKDVPVKLAQAPLRAHALTAGAIEAANLLKILPKVERLAQLNQGRTNYESISDEELALKVDVMDRVMGGALEVRMAADRIDRELAWSFSGQGMLQARRQKILNNLFTANFMQGGVLGIVAGPEFLHGNRRAGIECLLLGSSIGLALSGVSFLYEKSGTRKIDGETTMLADVFHLSYPEPLHQPEIVLRFLNSVPPDAKTHKTRIDTLMDGWKLHDAQEQWLLKLAAVEPEANKYRENLRLIAKRIRMLFDTQCKIEELDADFLDLLRATDAN